MSPEYFFNDKSAILLHLRTRRYKNFASQRQNDAQKMQDAQVIKHCCIEIVLAFSLTLLCDIDLLFTFQYFDCDRHKNNFTRAGVTQRSLRTLV